MAPEVDVIPLAQSRIWTRDFALLWFATFSAYIGFYPLLPTLPVYLERLGGREAQIGLIIGIFSATAFVASPLSGWLSDRVGARASVLIGAALMCLSCLSYAFTRSLGWVLTVRALHGVGWGALTPATATLAGELSPPHRRGEALGVYGMGPSLALATGPAAGLWLARAAGHQALFQVLAAVSALPVGLILLVREPRPRAGAPRRSRGLGALISRPALGPAAVLFCAMTAYGALVSFVPLLATRRTPGDAGGFFLVYALTVMALRGVAGRISDRYGRGAALVPGLLMSTVSMLALSATHSTLTLLAAGLLYGFSMACVQPPSFAWAGDRAPRAERGVAMATVTASQDMGISLGSVLFGAVGELAGIGWLFAAAAAPGLIALAVFARVMRAGRERAADR